MKETRIPVVKQGEFLIIAIPGDAADADLFLLRDSLFRLAGNRCVKGVIIDLSLRTVIDSVATRTLRDVALGLKLQGAETVVAGIQPEVAYAMVQLGLHLEGMSTALDVEDGMEYLKEMLQRQ